jgi:demethylmenaquinone methyltransferase / 2-methoxy-6-polyprenyl-1,4-benzoquinol methylase
MPEQNPEAEKTASGTRYEGARDEQETSRRVREMFSGIAPRYDLLNHLLSLRFDSVWRKRVARRYAALLARADARVLDLCCGTGDLAIALGRNSAARITGVDFSHEMLALARGKAAAAKLPIEFVEADALRLPFGDGTFDLVTTAFGFRNLANYGEGLKEIRRVLRAGGEIAILEFCEPRGKIFGGLYRFYFRRILPGVGGVISGDSAAYSYLPRSVGRFPGPEELAELMDANGFEKVQFQLWTGGIVALHTGIRA